jgi:hypothetical protein
MGPDRRDARSVRCRGPLFRWFVNGPAGNAIASGIGDDGDGMSGLSLRDQVARMGRAYAPGQRRPLGGYVKSMVAYAGASAGLAVAVRAGKRPLPERFSLGDVLLLSIATHKLSRLLTKESVTSPLRAPFVRYTGPAGHAELHEQVRADGSPTRHAVGELVTCPFCMAVWVATGLGGGLVLAPRPARLAATILTVVAASDFLQLAYAAAQRAAEGDRRPG